MRVVLIGSNGTLATAIGQYCNKCGYNLKVYGRSKPLAYECQEFVMVNLLKDDIDKMSFDNADIVIYSAGAGIQSNKNETFGEIYRLNVEVPIFIYQMLSSNEMSPIFASFGSYFEIGSILEHKAYSEEDVIASLNPVPNDYCVTKRLLTRFFSSVKEKNTFYHFILPTIYSELEPENRLIPYIIKGIVTHQKMEFTSGEQVRQYLYVGEIPKIIDKAFQKHIPSGIYNIAGNEILTIKNLVKNVMKHYGLIADDSMFRMTGRQDVSMKFLHLDGNKLSSLIGDYGKSFICSNLEKYEKRFQV